ncbi:hypothetical protein LPJ61_003047 [Coemansia biformis]|uniref:Ras-GEF domain-containing protein n=1 Tax=Coemansia biformis TaxID=1286918 RepID=A0A9W8CWM4_9FUNG|nr:hypothetical protein LPJ61_003047 [Coemansia biformis]
MTDCELRRPADAAVMLTKTDLACLHEISSHMKVVREPVRELARVATASTGAGAGAGDGVDPASPSALLLARLREQLEITQRILHEYLASVPGIPADHPALVRRYRVRGEDSGACSGSSSDRLTRTRNRRSTQDSGVMPHMWPSRPASLGTVSAADSHAAAPLLASLTGGHMSRKPSSADGVAAGRASGLLVLKRASADGAVSPAGLCMPAPPTPLPEGPATPGLYAIEKAIVRLWRGGPLATAPAIPVNEVCVRLGKRHIAPLEERVPNVPARTLVGPSSSVPVDIIDLVNSLFKSSARDNEMSLFSTKIETIPPGIVACAIANSTSQLFERLTVDLVAQYASSAGSEKSKAASGTAPSAQPILRLLSDHANFLTRLMETTILYSIHAAERARRIEWWAVVTCLLRELGDYESLSSLVCVFSGAAVGRQHDAWELVSAPCKAAIRFILERVLKIHPNYSSYRDELRMRIRRIQKKRTRLPAGGRGSAQTAATASGSGLADDESLDFDSAIAINTPDLCSSDDNYVNSCVFSKEGFDLPPPRVLVPIVAVLLKDAVTSEASEGTPAAASRVRPANGAPLPAPVPAAATDSALHWRAVIESCRNGTLPLALDYFLLRRIFATELSSLPQLATHKGATPRGAMSTASSFLRLMPRRSSSLGRGDPKELSMASCRLRGGGRCVPTIVDMLAHLLYIAAGNSCFSCSMGSLLENLHVSTSGQLAVAVTSMMLFAEHWMPREYLARLCDMREPRLQQARGSVKSPPPLPPLPPRPPHANVRMSVASHSHGYESRLTERPWLMSFKLSDSAETTRYYKTKASDGKDAPPVASVDAEAASGGRPLSSQSKGESGAPAGEPLRAPEPPDRLRRRSHRRSHSLHAPQPRAAADLFTAPQGLAITASPPPLPTVEMPTWLPAAGPQPLVPLPPLPEDAVAVAVAAASDVLALPQQPPPPPPLPALPMPRFQPATPAPVAPVGKMPPIFSTLPPDSQSKQKHLESISAETQMLLRFDSKNCKH